jgi:hypothetical protein
MPFFSWDRKRAVFLTSLSTCPFAKEGKKKAWK